MSAIWENISLGEMDVHYLQIGALHLWAKYQNQEVWIAHGYDDEVDGQPSKNNIPGSSSDNCSLSSASGSSLLKQTKGIPSFQQAAIPKIRASLEATEKPAGCSKS